MDLCGTIVSILRRRLAQDDAMSCCLAYAFQPTLDKRILIVRPTENKEPLSMFNPIGSKAVVCAFAHRPDIILTGHESGKIALFDAKTGDELASNEHAHRDVVTDLQLSPDRSYFITSSKDKTARVGLYYIYFQSMLTVMPVDP